MSERDAEAFALLRIGLELLESLNKAATSTPAGSSAEADMKQRRLEGARLMRKAIDALIHSWGADN